MELARCGNSQDGRLECSELLGNGRQELAENIADVILKNTPLVFEFGTQLPNQVGIPVDIGTLLCLVVAIVPTPRIVLCFTPVISMQRLNG